MIKLNKVRKTYHLGEVAQTVLHDVDLHIAAGELVAIMGPSGSGKSTLMNIIGLLDRPTKGHYQLLEQDTAALDDNAMASLRNKTIGFVFQQFFLLPRLTALDNTALPLLYSDSQESELQPRAMAMLAKMGMEKHSHHKPNELSGGQQQRVAIARALVNEPKLILADEPTGALDSKTGQEVIDLFLRLNQEEKTTVIIITHDPNVAAQCRRTITIADGIIHSA